MYTKEQLDYLYSLLIDENNDVLSLTNQKILDYLLITRSRKFINPLKSEFYSVYNRDMINKLCKRKQAIFRNRIRNSKQIKYSDSAKEKMKISRKKFWESIKDTDKEIELKEISRNSMKKLNSTGCNQTDAAKLKRLNSRRLHHEEWHAPETIEKIRIANSGKTRSDDTKNRMSAAAKGKPKLNRRGNLNPSKRPDVRIKISNSVTYQHRTGAYPLKTKSRGHSEIEKILMNLGYDIVNEFRIGRYSYDMFINSLSTVIEFHGTYWHLDPKKYDANFYDKSKNRYAKEQWRKDDQRKAHAISNNLRYLVVWQSEWECLDESQKIEKIKQLI